MRTEKRTFEVYAINELSQQTQSKAYYKWLELFDYSWADKNRATLKAFSDLFRVKCTKYSYDTNKYNYCFKTTLTGEEEELGGQRLEPTSITTIFPCYLLLRYIVAKITARNARADYSPIAVVYLQVTILMMQCCIQYTNS